MSNEARCDTNDVIPQGLRSREFAKFRTPRYDEVVAAVENEGVAIYPTTVNATASGNTKVLDAPGVGKCVRIKVLMLNNVGADQRVVYLREGTTGDARFKNSMPQYGSMWNANLISAYWILESNAALYVNLDGVGDVNVQIGYDIVKAIPVKELTDVMSISEDLVTTYVDNS